MNEWSDDELEALGIAYRTMQRFHAEGRANFKAAFYRELSERLGRTAKAFERRLQDISWVLDQRGESWLEGLAPAGHAGANVGPRIQYFLAKHPGPFPVPGAAYQVKLPALRQWLIRVAQRGEVVTYGQVMAAFGIDRFSIRFALSRLGRQSKQRGEPILTAMVVNKVTRHCGPGFEKEFGIRSDDAEREKLHKFWKQHPLEFSPPSGEEEERKARFVSVEARPDQAAFRRRVFEACGGRCVISGCDVVATLDAAHISGRDWRKHNKASDGYLMRKDLHAIYDEGLLTISPKGRIKLDKSVLGQYGQFAGKKVKTL